MKTGPELKRANLRLLFFLILFAITFAVIILIWKYSLYRTERAHQTPVSNPTPALNP